MPRVTIKKIARHGNSHMVVVPKPFCQAMGLLRGDFVEMTLDEINRDVHGQPTLRVRALYARKLKPLSNEHPQGIADVNP